VTVATAANRVVVKTFDAAGAGAEQPFNVTVSCSCRE